MPKPPKAKPRIDLSPSKLRKLADEELMELVCRNEAVAFEVVMERHVDAAFSLAYRMIGRRALAEDVVQEALLSLWRTGARYDRSRGSVRNWILGITHHRAVDAMRRDGVRTSKNVSDEGLGERLRHRSAPMPRRSGATRLGRFAALWGSCRRRRLRSSSWHISAASPILRSPRCSICRLEPSRVVCAWAWRRCAVGWTRWRC